MSRLFRRFLVRVLPVSVKSWARCRLARKSTPDARVPLEVFSHPEAGQVTVRVGNLPALLFDESVLFDLRLHCESPEHAPELRAFLDGSGSNGLLIDVGAHNGFFSLLYACAHPANRVLAFEPSDELRSRASHLVAINHLSDRVEISSCAVSDKAEDISFFRDSASGFVQSQAFSGHENSGFTSVKLQATTLDYECQARQLKPSVIKVDVEGYEWEVLQGAQQTLKTHHPVIFLELHLNYLEQRGLEPRNVLALLETCGYRFFSTEGKHQTLRSIAGSWQPVIRIVARHVVSSAATSSAC
jgi:FkbM family methyltransferase